MRKWLFFLVILALVYGISKVSRKKGVKSPFLKRVNETITILVWVLLAGYTLAFLYWLYTAIFK